LRRFFPAKLIASALQEKSAQFSQKSSRLDGVLRGLLNQPAYFGKVNTQVFLSSKVGVSPGEHRSFDLAETICPPTFLYFWNHL
jgi:hypothetical protein